jgi:hypothetical protein
MQPGTTSAIVGGFMTEHEAAKRSADLLRTIIRSVDKKLDYKPIDSAHEGRFSLRLTLRGRSSEISLLTSDLRLALADDVRKNAIRQKLKSARDHLLSNYVGDVMDKKMAKMLAQASTAASDGKSSFFYRRPRERR